ncbi:MAG: glycosyltransferase family 2 protein [Rhodospirillales bacterium]|jgi:glycosyltransferase involved in cell wall biosynthesis|nr:glycosyltransferase family 2 protein [Rhodospirillales bacterium]
MKLSAVISVHNEEERLAACLDCLTFAEEIVVLLDRCTDGTEQIAARYTERLIHGAWEKEGDRRNAGIDACAGDWILEVDADEHVPAELAREITETIGATSYDWHEIPVHNYVGTRLVRHGWGASYGKAAYPGLFRNGAKEWGLQRVHPRLLWSGRKGPMLKNPLRHYVDRDISDMIRRLDNYSTARAKDMVEAGEIGSTANNIRRFFSRFIKCYLGRGGYKEGGLGFVIAVFAGLYPLISHLKARAGEP